MEEQLKQLIELRTAATAAVEALKTERQAITDGAKAEARAGLSEEEFAEFRAKTAAIKAKNAEIDALTADVTDLEAEIARAGTATPEVRRVVEANSGGAIVTEPSPTSGQRQVLLPRPGPIVVGMADEDAKERLQRHAVDVSTNARSASSPRSAPNTVTSTVTTAPAATLVPPLWVMNELDRAGPCRAPYANLVPSKPLPGGTDSINIPKINTRYRRCHPDR
jgi:hypothetical protein